MDHSTIYFKQSTQQYEKYMAANDVSKGGSFYLQSKVYRAKEMLDKDIAEQNSAGTTEDKSQEDSKP